VAGKPEIYFVKYGPRWRRLSRHTYPRTRYCRHGGSCTYLPKARYENDGAVFILSPAELYARSMATVTSFVKGGGLGGRSGWGIWGWCGVGCTDMYYHNLVKIDC
jgi:hypothetical protein